MSKLINEPRTGRLNESSETLNLIFSLEVTSNAAVYSIGKSMIYVYNFSTVGIQGKYRWNPCGYQSVSIPIPCEVLENNADFVVHSYMYAMGSEWMQD